MVAPTNQSQRQPSQTVLRELPGRVLTFLVAMSRASELRGYMALGGYGQPQHEEGQALLGALCRWPQGEPTAELAAAAAEGVRALAELELWARTQLPRLRAAAARFAPDYAALFVLGAACPGRARGSSRRRATSGACVLAVARLLQVLGTDAQGGALRKLLSARGLDEGTLARLQHLVAVATARGPVASSPPEQTAALLSLYRWYRDWSAAARRLVPHRSGRVALGLVRRRTRRR
jgi:hypothetical protein